MLLVGVRFRHPCAFSRISTEFPEVRISHWCNSHSEYVEIAGFDERRARDVGERIARLAESGFRVIRSTRDGEGTLNVALTCAHKPRLTIDYVIEKNGGLLLPPVIYHWGWELYRILLPEAERLPQLVARLGRRGEVRLVQKTEVGVGPLHGQQFLALDSLFRGLTNRQTVALLRSIESGYYDIPRRVTLQEIAHGAGTPRTTFEEHVHKAETKVLRALGPFLALRAGSGTGGRANGGPSRSVGGGTRSEMTKHRELASRGKLG